MRSIFHCPYDQRSTLTIQSLDTKKSLPAPIASGSHLGHCGRFQVRIGQNCWGRWNLAAALPPGVPHRPSECPRSACRLPHFEGVPGTCGGEVAQAAIVRWLKENGRLLVGVQCVENVSAQRAVEIGGGNNGFHRHGHLFAIKKLKRAALQCCAEIWR